MKTKKEILKEIEALEIDKKYYELIGDRQNIKLLQERIDTLHWVIAK